MTLPIRRFARVAASRAFGSPRAITCVIAGLLLALAAPPARAAQPALSGREPAPRSTLAPGDTLVGVELECADFRGGDPVRVRGQRVLASGVIDSTWTGSSGQLCLGSTRGVASARIPDGAGGALVVWADARSGNADLYAQHLTSGGVPASGWTWDGLPVCSEPNAQQQVALCSDGQGGAIAVWQDYRSDAAADLYAQRITSDGQLAWAAGGVPIRTGPLNQATVTLAPDVAGGALIVWQEGVADGGDLYFAHLAQSGSLVGEPTPLVAAAGGQSNPRLVSDGLYGVFLIWEDSRGGDLDLYALHLGLDGTPTAEWPATGLLLAGGARDQMVPAIAITGGNAIVAYCDRDSGRGDIRVQKLTAAPALAWGAGGVALCGERHEQYGPAIVADGDSGAIVAWEDYRFGRSDIFARRVSGAGVALWDTNGVAICRVPGDQFGVALASDGEHGALATWIDTHSPGHASFLRQTPILAGGVPKLLSVEKGPGRAKIVYQSEPDDRRGLLFERRLEGEDWQTLAVVRAATGGEIVAEDRTVAPGAHVRYRLSILQGADRFLLEEIVLDIPQAMPLTLRFMRGDPDGRNLRISLILATNEPATFELFDVQGRRVQQHAIGDLGAGEHDFRLPLKGYPGVYFARLTQGRQMRQGRVVITR